MVAAVLPNPPPPPPVALKLAPVPALAPLPPNDANVSPALGGVGVVPVGCDWGWGGMVGIAGTNDGGGGEAYGACIGACAWYGVGAGA